MKKGLFGVLRALAVLAGLWLILGGIALVAGVVPPGGVEPEQQPSDREGGPVTVAAGDGGASAGEGAAVARGADGGPAAEAALPADGRPVARWTVCDAAVTRPVVAALQVLGSPSPELIIGCDAVAHLVVVSGGSTPGLVRVATFDGQSAEEGGLGLHAGPPAAGDVDGDGLPDLLLPFWQSTRDGATRGGRLHLVRREESGGFEAPRLLGPIAAVAVALGQLDGRPGLDVVALNRGSELARRPSEVWVYAGGAAPVRSAVLRSGVGAQGLVLADLDGDEHLDVAVVVKNDARVDVFFGDGAGRFPRSATAAVPGAAEASAVDLDGDGSTDLLVRGDGTHLLRFGPEGHLDTTALDVPQDLSQLTAVDVTGDGRRDLVGLAGGALAVLPRLADLAFQEAQLHPVEGMTLARLVLLDLDGDGTLEAAALGRAAPDAPWDLALLDRLTDPAPRHASGPVPLPDAPLTLRLTLP